MEPIRKKKFVCGKKKMKGPVALKKKKNLEFNSEHIQDTNNNSMDLSLPSSFIMDIDNTIKELDQAPAVNDEDMSMLKSYIFRF